MIRGIGVVLHRLATLALGAAVVLAVIVAGAAWRLSQGPVDLPWLTPRLEEAANANAAGARLTIGGTALAWEGFRLGVDRPLDLRLTDIRLTGTDGRRQVEIPRAEVSLSVAALLLGRLQPRALELDQPRLTVFRAEDGTFGIDLGEGTQAQAGTPTSVSVQGPVEPLPTLLALLAKPPTAEANAGPGWYRQWRRVHIRDAAITVIDRRLGATWLAPQADLTLIRGPGGGIDGVADLVLALGDQQARLNASATLSPDAAETRLVARLSPVRPAALAQAAPALGPLAAVDAPVGAEATAMLGPALDLREGRLTLQSGAGVLHIGPSAVPMDGGSATVSGTPAAVRLEAARLQVRRAPGQPVTTLTAEGTANRVGERLESTLSLGFDRVAFADLPVLWPEGVAHNARDWVLENIPAGVARDGRFTFDLAATSDLSVIVPVRASGSLSGSDLTVWWLRPIPPLVQGQAVLRVLDPDTLEIEVSSARQSLRSGGGLAVTGGTVRIPGLLQRDQTAVIQVNVTGSVPGALELLREPRLQLLDKHPVELNDPAGEVAVRAAVTVPLEKAVLTDDIGIRVDAHLDKVFLRGLIAGRDLSAGSLDLVADTDGLTVKGTALLAGIPATLDAAMDFRAGLPTEVMQRVKAAGQADAKQLAAAGLDATDVMAGPLGLQAELTELRNGAGTLAVSADLVDTTLSVKPLEWSKPAGQGASASAQLRLQRDRLVGIDRIEATGKGLLLRGSAVCDDGRVSQVRLDRVTLSNSDLAGTVLLPAASRRAPIAVRLTGPMLDLSARLARPGSGSRTPPQPEPPPGPSWTLDAKFDTVRMAGGYLLAPIEVHAENDGSVLQRLRLDGATRDKGPFTVQIAPEDGQRRLTITAAETGDLLRALDATGTMQGGKLTLRGTYNDAKLGRPLQGTVELTDFRILRAAALGKLLQAMTLYGLVDVLRGPGLAFTRLVAPFTLTDGRLDLGDARAFSPSLGLTATGQMDLDAGTADLRGTIVPAYFFNSLLGNVPLVGRLFSPERGGGLFAASYRLRGDLDDPAVAVNPLTALTPGFLRGLFGLFEPSR